MKAVWSNHAKEQRARILHSRMLIRPNDVQRV